MVDAAYESLAAAAQEAESLQAEYAGVFDPVLGLLGKGVIIGPYGSELLQRVHALAVRTAGTLAGLRADIEDELARMPVPHGCRPFYPVTGPVRAPLDVSDAGWPAGTVGIYPGRAGELIHRIEQVSQTLEAVVAERMLEICHAADISAERAFAAGETGAELADVVPQVQVRLAIVEHASGGHLPDTGTLARYDERVAAKIASHLDDGTSLWERTEPARKMLEGFIAPLDMVAIDHWIDQGKEISGIPAERLREIDNLIKEIKNTSDLAAKNPMLKEAGDLVETYGESMSAWQRWAPG
jgi:hypothetical protein